MMSSEKKLFGHQMLLIGVMLIWTVVRLVTGRWSLTPGILLWWLGGVIGFLFVFMDRFIYAFMQNPNETLSLQLRELFSRGKLIKGLNLAFRESGGQERLVIRSALFLFVYLIMMFFTVTSVGSYFGRGFMLGLGLHLVFDLASDYRGKGRDVRLWFWQIKRELTVNEIAVVFWGFVILFSLMALGL